MKVEVCNLITNEKHIFPTQKDAAEFLEIPTSTMVWRMKNRTPTNGWVCEKVPLTDKEVAKLEKQLARKRELNKVGFIQDSISDSDREKYRVFKYEKNHANVCITPCPFYLAPKPRIGSARCQDCSYFHGIDRTRLEVACARDIEKANRRKSYYGFK